MLTILPFVMRLSDRALSVPVDATYDKLCPSQQQMLIALELGM